MARIHKKKIGITEFDIQVWFQSPLFDLIPLNIAIIDKKYNVVHANNNFKECFGEWKGRKCYNVYKGVNSPCKHCGSMKTFGDRKVRFHEQEGIDAQGDPAYYVVHTAPVIGPDSSVSYVLEMSKNITDIKHSQREYQILFERVPCYIAVLDRDMRIVRANEKLRETFGDCRGKHCYEVYKKQEDLCEDCPALMSFKDGKEHKSTHVGLSKDGEETHYAVTASPLTKGEKGSSHVLEILTDITQMKLLEKEKLDAERLAAVGQTVAGLAHSVKNILMGVEGGMYMVSSGIEKDDKERLMEGWETLERNIHKVSTLVKDFLSFSKGRKPAAKLVDPNSLVDEIISLYKDTAKNIGVELKREDPQIIEPAPLDPDGIHTCLTNLVSNAIDACQLGKNASPQVTINVFDNDNVINIEVSDNGCGLDYDIRDKVFTTFFTTKGGKGTGLGLLTTRKIVQEHGGKIAVESLPGNGSTFRIELPRERLPQPEESTSQKEISHEKE